MLILLQRKKKEIAIIYRIRDLKIIRDALLRFPISYVPLIICLSIRDNATSVENQINRTLSFRSTVTFYVNFEFLLRACLGVLAIFATKSACAKRSSQERHDRRYILVHCVIYLHIHLRKGNERHSKLQTCYTLHIH